ncbi:MAG: RNA polymerase factor sigma-54 [Kiritimatiellae bacterium]|nr:RNA polymerase factor sigma-54 [Kiritimatiellia bacterium]
MIALSTEVRTRQTQTTTLAPHLRQGVELLAMNLPELRERLYEEMSRNPCIEDIEPTLETTTVSAKVEEAEAAGESQANDYPDEDFEPSFGTAAALTRDEEADERRQRFFDSQTQEETLEEHLMKQVKLSDMTAEDAALAEILIGEFDANGRFAGSLPDLEMVTGESEERILSVLRQIMQFDPPGCGARTAQECLLAQLDKLDGSPYKDEVRALIERHFVDMAEGRIAVIERDLGISHERYADLLREVRTLDPRPGRAYDLAGKSISYVHPEVHAVRTSEGWRARVDDRSLPEIHISPRYMRMLQDPAVGADAKAYIRSHIEAAKVLIDAVERRQETVTNIAQAIFDAQPGFFEKGLKGIRPLTMQEIAAKLGINHTTVSRTVRDKYVSTPKGTVELRKFFAGGLTTDSGEQVTTEVVHRRLKELVDAEDKKSPLSDDALSARLKAEGFPVARRTVAKYRAVLGIPGLHERRR